jgi:arylsulfatase A
MAEERLNHQMNTNEFETNQVVKKRLRIGLIVQACLVLLLAPTASAAKPPNIILIMADDFGWDISALGETAYQTPEMDRLIRGGMQLSDFHSNGACCTPTRAAFLTAKYQQRTGLVVPMNSEFHSHAGMPSDEVTLAEVLHRANYRTALFGKWHLGEAGDRHPLGQGFDEFKGFLAGNIDHHSHVNRVPNRDWWDGRTLKDQKGYSTDLINDNTVSFIDEHHDKPFFIFVAHAATHGPFQDRESPVVRPLGKPEVTRVRHTKQEKEILVGRVYPNMVRAIDEGVGKIVNALEKHSISDNTIIFFMSDNGPVLEGRRGRHGDLVGNKGNIEEGGHRVPAFVYWPGHIEAGSRSTATLMGMDLMPTFASLAGVDISDLKNIDGVDASRVFLRN